MWVVEKIRVSVERTNLPLPSAEYTFRMGELVFGDKSHKSKNALLCPNVITPETIPEFCIPPKIPSPPEAKASRETVRPAPVIRVSPCERRARARGEASAAARDLFRPHVIQVESVDEGPSCDGNGGVCSDEEATDADPRSQAALSLPHLAKAQTCYGFCTLLESPHTRRKESLFHGDPAACGAPLLFPRSRSGTCSRAPPPSARASYGLNTLASRLSPRGYALSRQGTVDSDTASSAESSPFSSPLLARCPAKSSLLKALSHEGLVSQGGANKRAAVSRNDSLSTDDGSSTDNSPNVMRRASEGLLAEGPPRSFSLAPPPNIFPTDLVLHRDRVLKESLVPVGKDGVLRLSAEYCPDNQQLRVRLISAEAMYPASVDPRSISCSVSLSLVPGKLQKQRSTVIRKSRNPIFNEDFFFDGVSEEDLSERSLRFKVVNKMSTMKRDYVLGDCELVLASILTS